MAIGTRRHSRGDAALHRGRKRQGQGPLQPIRGYAGAPACHRQVMSDLAIFWPALVAGLLVTATHVPLGIQVLNRGIVFIDLAVAQIAGLGVILGDWLGFEHHGVAVQISALSAALIGALLLNWTERLWPEVQEAIIGVAFILAANAAILLLAANPQGAEHLKDLLVGQILWVKPAELPLLALVTAIILALSFWSKHR